MDRILAGMWQAIKEQMVEDFSIFGLFALVILVLCIILVLLLRRRTTPQVGLSKIRSADTLLPLDPEPHFQAQAPAEPGKEETKPLPQAASSLIEPLDAEGVRFLGTLPFVSSGLFRRESAPCAGLTVHAVFFDPEELPETDDTARRLIPFLPEKASEVLVRESDRRNFRTGVLVAQPDAVLMLEKGLVNVEFKSKGGRFDDVTAWHEKLRPADLYQTLLAAMAVSLEEARPVAPVLRTMNAVYFLHPSAELVAELARLAPKAAQFLESDTVSAKDAADLAAVVLRKRYGQTNREGEIAHRAMLR